MEHSRYQRYIGAFTDGTDNNFNLIRLLCAWGVLVFHSVPLAHPSNNILEDYIYRYFGVSTGEFCVMVFFSISGFLIYRSMCRSSLLSYIIARALRLLPALFVVLLLTAFVVGPLVSELSINQYFSHSETWSYLKNINLLTNRTQYTLPGVFTDNPYPNAVNGSLWTLPLETRMYVVTIAFFFAAWLLSKLLKDTMRWLSPLLLLSILVGAYFQLDHYASNGQRHDLFKNLFYLSFFMGGVLYAYRDKIPLRASWAIALLLGVELLRNTTIYPIYGTFTIVYSVLVLAYLPKGKLLAFNKLGDYSYGMYIFAFPVQQCLAHWTNVSFWEMVVWATLITLALSIVSWHFIESPMLGYKKKIISLFKKPINVTRLPES